MDDLHDLKDSADVTNVVVYTKAEHFVANDKPDNNHAIGAFYTFVLTRPRESSALPRKAHW